MTRPGFVLVGVPKAGTTSLHRYLGQHPGVNVTPLDEVNFLSYPGPERARTDYPTMSFRITTIEAYDALFAETNDRVAEGRVAVDFSASCFASDVAVGRITTYISSPRLLVLLRDPCDRAYSAYLHRVRKGYEDRSPADALVPGERVVELGFYADRIAEFRRAFGSDNVRVWLLDDLRADPEATLSDVLSYLGVEPGFGFDTETVHNKGTMPRHRLLPRMIPSHTIRRKIAGVVPSRLLGPARWAWERAQRPADPLPPAVEARLRDLYADDIHVLEGLLGRDLSPWIQPGVPRSAPN